MTPEDLEREHQWIRKKGVTSPPYLPRYDPVTEERSAPPEFVAKEYGSTFPELQTLADGYIVVDWWKGLDDITVKVWKRGDHPNLKLLPDDTPQIVKNMYRASKQLAILRMTALDSSGMDVGDAWDAYLTRRGL